MNRELMETLMTGILLTSDSFEQAQEEVFKMFTFKEVMELSEKDLDPGLVFIQLVESLKVQSK